jgi:hypothetical protein
LVVGVKCDVGALYLYCTRTKRKREREGKEQIGDDIHRRVEVCRACHVRSKVMMWGGTVQNVRWNIVRILDGVEKWRGVLRMLGMMSASVACLYAEN